MKPRERDMCFVVTWHWQPLYVSASLVTSSIIIQSNQPTQFLTLIRSSFRKYFSHSNYVINEITTMMSKKLDKSTYSTGIVATLRILSTKYGELAPNSAPGLFAHQLQRLQATSNRPMLQLL